METESARYLLFMENHKIEKGSQVFRCGALNQIHVQVHIMPSSWLPIYYNHHSKDIV